MEKLDALPKLLLNYPYCKELLNLVSELRHLDGLKGGIAINESEYMATTVLQEAPPLTEVIYSDVDEVVTQGQYIFDTLWRHSTPAFKRIREIEYGIEPIKTEVLISAEEIADKIYKIIRVKVPAYVFNHWWHAIKS